MNNLFSDQYVNKRVLITGHTGFKGSWLALWLQQLGAHVAGFSLYLPSDPCNYDVLKLSEKIIDIRGDIRDHEGLMKAFDECQPEIVFHLAAQPIVRNSYSDPKLTFDTNLGGTVNILECIRQTTSVKAAVLITSDKCYQNLEWTWGYRENDRLGGDDPYSASKACAEMAFHAYCQSFFKASQTGRTVSMATTRAGNVIGGGDWAADRIIPDAVRALASHTEPVIRNPEATRPWQHVLEPLSGYLCLGADLMRSRRLNGESFNFGPDPQVNTSVSELLNLFLEYWGRGSWKQEKAGSKQKESTLLKLCCDKALHFLDWKALFTFEETVRLTAEWYKTFYSRDQNMHACAMKQIEFYVAEARRQGVPWAGEGRA